MCFSKSTRVLVLDSCAFIMGYDPLIISELQFTTSSIQDELKTKNLIWERFKIASEIGKLVLISPSSNTKEYINRMAIETGDNLRLSEIDKDVLAVAVELRGKGGAPIIISDDYSIQNLAEKLKLAYMSLSTLGIRYRFQWSQFCPACHREYLSNYYDKTCKVCGTLLKRKSIKKSNVKRKNGP